MIEKFFKGLMSGTLDSRTSEPALYVLTPLMAERLDRWAEYFPDYDLVVGYSLLGHVFLRSSANKEYAVLHPFKKAAKSYGVFASASDFENDVLKEAGFSDYVLRSAHLDAVRKIVGPVGVDEIYIPKPYPFMGGSDEPETYSRGNIWVFLSIVAQAHGL